MSGGSTPTPTFYAVSNAYNAFGEQTQKTYPNGDTDTFTWTGGFMTGNNGETYTRDARGNVLTRTDRNTNTWTMTYDDLDRILTMEDPTGSRTLLTWTGPLLTQVESGRTASGPGRVNVMTYDAAGRLTRIQRQTSTGLVTRPPSAPRSAAPRPARPPAWPTAARR